MDITELQRQFGQRIQAQLLSELPKVALESRYVFVSNATMFSRISEIRMQISAHAMPICALTHSLYTRELLFGYTSLLMSAEQHDVIVASSDAGKQTIENLFAASRERIAERLCTAKAGLSNPKIVKIPFGVDLPSEAELDRERSRVLLRIPPASFVVLYFGRITEEYKADLDPLLQAVHYLKSLGHDVWMILAGQSLDLAYSEHLESRMVALGISETSIFLENCPEFLKSSVYAACDVMVSPADSVQETFGLSILEAMAHARPVVASDWSGYRELVVEGETGFLIRTIWTSDAAENASMLAILAPPLSTAHYLSQRTIMDVGALVERLAVLLGNAELRASMGKAGRARVEAYYTWPDIADQFLELWDEQMAVARSATSRVIRSGLNCFSHYATAILCPEDLLVRLPGLNGTEVDVLKQWRFYDVGALDQVGRLLELTSNSPISIGELRDEGFDLDSILWLAKKGLRHIVKASDEDRSPPNMGTV